MRGKRRTRGWPRSCDRWSRLSAIPTSWCRKPRPSSTRWNGTRASCVAGVAIPRHPLTALLPPSCHRCNRTRSISWSRAPGRSRKTFVRSPVSFRWTSNGTTLSSSPQSRKTPFLFRFYRSYARKGNSFLLSSLLHSCINTSYILLL